MAGNYQRHKSLKMEDIIPKVYYSMSLNPEEQYPKTVDRYSKVKEDIKLIFNEIQTIDYIFNMEVSPTGRLHFHGIICFHGNPLYFYLYFLPKLNLKYSYEIDTINDSHKWITYCNKQYDIWREMCIDPIVKRWSKGALPYAPERSGEGTLRNDAAKRVIHKLPETVRLGVGGGPYDEDPTLIEL